MELLFELLPDLPRDSLRLVGHTLNNLMAEAGPASLDQLVLVLPLLSAVAKLEAGGDEHSVAHEIQRSLNHLPLSKIEEAVRGFKEHGTGVELTRLRSRNSAVQTLIDLPPNEARNLLFSSTELMEMCGLTDAPACLRSMWDLDHTSTRSLRALNHFEEYWNKQRLQALALSERSIRFELSAVQHLHEHGYLPAVRAALAFAGRPEAIHELDIFRNDTPLRVLAQALLAMRQRVLDHVRGLLPLQALSGWTNYLQGPCSDLAEARGITRTEAMSFAHFALHLMNMCDLIEALGEETHDEIRRSICDVEDGLKEFATMRKSGGFEDSASLERAVDPWGARPDLHRLADRLARLNGLWSLGGSRRGLVGMGRLDLEVCRPYLNALHRLEPRDLEHVAKILRFANLTGDLAGWEPEPLVCLLVSLGRNLPDYSGTIELNLVGVTRLMDTCPALGELFLAGAKQSIRIEQKEERLNVSLDLAPELKALLDVASHSTDPRLIEMAQERIRSLLGVQSSAPAESGFQSTSVQDEARA